MRALVVATAVCLATTVCLAATAFGFAPDCSMRIAPSQRLMPPRRAVVVQRSSAPLRAPDEEDDAGSDAVEALRELFLGDRRRPGLDGSAGDDEDDDAKSSDLDAMRELFLEAVEAEPGASTIANLKTASLFDLNDVQFKMLMRERLGEADYNKVFKDPRVDGFDVL